MNYCLISSLIFVLFNIISCEERLQGIAVRGRFLCGDGPAKHITVKIIDKDKRPDLDDLLDETSTDEDGNFALSGATIEETDMEPAIKVYHDCEDEDRPCQRKMQWDIPKRFVNNGTVSNWYARLQWFNIGQINLQLQFKGEERDCRHRRRRHLRRHGHRKLHRVSRNN